MLLFAASIVALVVGPLLFELLRERRGVMASLDGFVLVAIIGLVILHLLPGSIALGGWWAAGAAVIGLALPTLLDRWIHRAGRKNASKTVLLTVLAGLTVHAVLDGAAVVSHGHHGDGHEHTLAVAVVLHRLPFGLVLWWLVRPVWGITAATLLLALVAGATALGSLVGLHALDGLPSSAMAVFEALIAGSLFHIVFHHPPELDRSGSVPGGVGGMVAIALLAAASASHGDHAGTADAGATFLTLALETAPALLVAFVGAGLLRGTLRPHALGWLGRGGPSGQVARGTAFGLPLPICSCGVVPLYESLIASGVPATAGLAFLVATPELGLDAVLISIPLLGPELTIARVIAAFVLAVVIGRLVGSWIERRRTSTLVDAASQPEEPLRQRILGGLRYGLGDLVDHTFPWILVGLGLGALIEPVIDVTWLAGLPAGLDVLLCAVIGIPVYICATGSTPFVAVLLAKGLSPGAGIAFLLTGPATNTTTFGILSRLHGRRAALLFGVTAAAGAIALGLTTNALLGDVSGLGLADAREHGPSSLQVICLFILAGLVALSILRRGPRRLLAGMTPDKPGGDGLHDHAHDHEHGHACH